MQRRKFVQLLAAGGISIPIAGCAGGTDDDDESGENENGNGGNGDSGENNDTSGDNNDDENSSGGGGSLEIIEHELYEEEFSAGVEGVVANNTGETLDYAAVEARFYDEDERQIADSLANTQDLEDGREWVFDAPLVGADVEDVADYDIEVSDSPF